MDTKSNIHAAESEAEAESTKPKKTFNEKIQAFEAKNAKEWSEIYWEAVEEYEEHLEAVRAEFEAEAEAEAALERLRRGYTID